MQILSKNLTRFPGVNVRIDVKEGNQPFHNTVRLSITVKERLQFSEPGACSNLLWQDQQS